jgi:hypothetical protein
MPMHEENDAEDAEKGIRIIIIRKEASETKQKKMILSNIGRQKERKTL